MYNIHYFYVSIISYLFLHLSQIYLSYYNYYQLLLLTNFKPVLSFVTLHIFYTDIHNFDIYEIDIIMLAIIILKANISINLMNILMILYLSLFVYKGYMGIGDLKLFIIFALHLELLKFCQLLFYSSSLCLFYGIIGKMNKVPYGPFIMIAYLCI